MIEACVNQIDIIVLQNTCSSSSFVNFNDAKFCTNSKRIHTTQGWDRIGHHTAWQADPDTNCHSVFLLHLQKQKQQKNFTLNFRSEAQWFTRDHPLVTHGFKPLISPEINLINNIKPFAHCNRNTNSKQSDTNYEHCYHHHHCYHDQYNHDQYNHNQNNQSNSSRIRI